MFDLSLENGMETSSLCAELAFRTRSTCPQSIGSSHGHGLGSPSLTVPLRTYDVDLDLSVCRENHAGA